MSIHFRSRLIAALLLFGVVFTNQVEAQSTEAKLTAPSSQMLDIRNFLRERFVTTVSTNPTFQSLVGTQSFDGLPFLIEGRGWVYGSKEADWGNNRTNDYPDFVGIAAGRKFDELHLLHASRWQEADGRDIALIRAHYDDGTTNDWHVVYGAHVRDWQRLHSEEKESLTDLNSKIVWRGEPRTKAMSSSVRLFKTEFVNPFPEKVVATLDVISSRRMAAYDLVAVTVANRDSKRPVSKPVAAPSRTFGRAVKISVVDAITAKPISGALLDPGMIVDGGGVIASPQLTGTNGGAEIRYPGLHMTSLFIQVEKPGYLPQNVAWGAKRVGPALWQRAIEYVYLVEGFVPPSVTVTLQPSNAPPAPPLILPSSNLALPLPAQ